MILILDVDQSLAVKWPTRRYEHTVDVEANDTTATHYERLRGADTSSTRQSDALRHESRLWLEPANSNARN